MRDSLVFGVFFRLIPFLFLFLSWVIVVRFLIVTIRAAIFIGHTN
jgi:hypothetical protein